MEQLYSVCGSSSATPASTAATEMISNSNSNRNNIRSHASSEASRQQQQQQHQHQNADLHSSSCGVLQELLLLLLTRLEIPFIHHTSHSNGDGGNDINNGKETTPTLLLVQLVTGILERLVPLVLASSTFLLLPDEAVVTLLRRLMQCRDSLNNHKNRCSFVWNASLAWLTVLNHHFFTVSEYEQQQQHHHIQGVWQQPWFLVPTMAECLRSAHDMLLSTPWDEAVPDVLLEVRVQWRILTGCFITVVVQQQQQDDNNNNVPHWLCLAFHQADPNLSDAVVTRTVQNILHTLLAYVTELTDHSLDALDGAAGAFQSSAVVSSSQDDWNNEDNNQYRIQREALTAAECAVQDSLRLISLATQLLETPRPWCQPTTNATIDLNNNCNNDGAAAELDADGFAARLDALQRQQLIHLWVTVAPAFLERSHLTTVLNYKEQRKQQQQQQPYTHHVTLENQSDNKDSLGYRICHLRIYLAELVLNQQQSDNASSCCHETSLCLSFLRGLEYPELLWTADAMWQVLEQRLQQQQQQQQARHHRDLRCMLRAAVLTLRKQHMLPADDIGAHAIVQRLLPLLLPPPPQQQPTTDPWDGFFLRQSAGLVLHNQVQGETPTRANN